jgi:hypothetical protein
MLGSMVMPLRRFALLLGSLVLGCKPPPASMAAGGETVRSFKILATDLEGLSSLAVGDGGVLLALPERQPVLLELSNEGAVLHRRLLVGAPQEVDFESLASLGGGRVAIGTEGRCEAGAGAAQVLIAERAADELRVTRALDVPLSVWGASCQKNAGIEGLCAASGQIVAAFERVLEEGGRRLAPLSRIDAQTGESAPFRLSLTSTHDQKGRISILDCRASGDMIEVVAIERHFKVSRVLAFTLPAQGSASMEPIVPRVLLDLSMHSMNGKRNFEGIVRLDERRLLLVVDNHYGVVTGPNELVEITLPP